MKKFSDQGRAAGKVIWIDLDNSPHVLFFAPIIRELEKRGYRVTLTARDCFQVCGLADLHQMKYLRLGRHYGKNKALKIFGTIYRSFQLLRAASKAKAEIALSHGSRSQAIASKILRMPSVVLADYEHSKGLRVVHPNFYIVPEVVKSSASKNGSVRQWLTYPGIKEDVYVPDFVPDRSILEELGIEEGNILVSIKRTSQPR